MNYLIYGTSFNLINEEIKKIVGEEEYRSVSLNDVSLTEILEDIMYDSMFDEKKILVLKNFECVFQSKKDNSESIEALLEYLKKPSDKNVLIFISSEKINEKSKVNKELLSKMQVIKTPVITKSYELAKEFGELIRKSGYGISQNALNIFCEKCASNYDIAVNEFEKLKQFKKENRLISEQDIEEFVSNYNMSDMFGFKDSVINKNIPKAISMLDDLETSKMEVLPLVVMLAKEYQTVYNVKSYASMKMNNDQIGEALGNMHPFRVKLLREAGNRYTDEDLQRIILYLCNLDLKLVSQDNLGFDEIRKFLLEL